MGIRPNIPKRRTKIHPSKITGDPRVKFSFRYLNLHHKHFYCRDQGKQYFIKLLERLHAICGIPFKDFISSTSQSLKSNKIDWKKSSHPKGFSHLNEQLKSCEPREFEISRNKHGRIYGFIIEPTFFIVWLDPNHNLFP